MPGVGKQQAIRVSKVGTTAVYTKQALAIPSIKASQERQFVSLPSVKNFRRQERTSVDKQNAPDTRFKDRGSKMLKKSL